MSFTKRTKEEARAILDARMDVLRSRGRLPSEPLVILNMFSRVRSEHSAFHVRMMWLALRHNRERVPESGAAIYYREDGVPPTAERDDGVEEAIMDFATPSATAFEAIDAEDLLTGRADGDSTLHKPSSSSLDEAGDYEEEGAEMAAAFSS